MELYLWQRNFDDFCDYKNFGISNQVSFKFSFEKEGGGQLLLHREKKVCVSYVDTLAQFFEEGAGTNFEK